MNRLSIAAILSLLIMPVAAHSATVSRHGTLHVSAQFTKSSSFSTPVRCRISANPDGAGGSTDAGTPLLGEEIKFDRTTGVGSCDITLPYSFEDIDRSIGVTVNIYVDTAFQARFSDGNLTPNFQGMGRSWEISIGIPSNGKTTVNLGNIIL